MTRYTLEIEKTDGSLIWDSFDGYMDALGEALYYAYNWSECYKATVINTISLDAKDVITFYGVKK